MFAVTGLMFFVQRNVLFFVQVQWKRAYVERSVLRTSAMGKVRPTLDIRFKGTKLSITLTTFKKILSILI